MPRLVRFLSFLLSIALLVLACGGGAEEPAATTITTLPQTTTLAPSTTLPPPASTVPTTTSTISETTTSTIPLVAANALAEGWEFEFLDLPSKYKYVEAFAASPSGMVLIGRGDLNEPLMWYSPDGSEWERVGEDVFITARLWDVAAGGPGFVAGGNDCSLPDPSQCAANPAVWTSVDGRAWLRVPHDPTVFPGCLDQGGHPVHEADDQLATCDQGGHRPSIWYVSATDHGLIATGTDLTSTFLWISEDGLAWTRLDSDLMPSYPKVEGQDWWIAPDYPGAWTSLGLIQPGFRCIAGHELEKCSSTCRGFIWSSPGGTEWAAETSLMGADEWAPWVAVESDAGIVVFGEQSPNCMWCWTEAELEPTSFVGFHSTDGTEWSRINLPGSTLGGSWQHSALATPIGFIAIAEVEWQPEIAGMWHSPDGLVWDVVPEIENQPDEFWPIKFEWHRGGLVVFGTASDAGDRVPVMGRWLIS